MKGLDLKVRRVEAGVRQYRVAAALDIPQASLSYWENEKHPIPLGMEERILAVIEDLRRGKVARVDGIARRPK